MVGIRVPRSGPGRPRTQPDAVLTDRAYTPRAPSGATFADAGYALSSFNPPTRSATASAVAGPAADRPLSTLRHTSNATRSNDASIA